MHEINKLKAELKKIIKNGPKGVTKRDIRKIIDEGWDDRRAQVECTRIKNIVACKKWKKREKLVLNNQIDNSNIVRSKHYLPDTPQ